MTSLKQIVQQHIGYNYWAHHRIWHYVMQLSDEQFTQPLDYSVGAIRNQVVHTMWSEETWLSRIVNQPLPTYTADDYPTRDHIRTKWDAIEAQMRQMITSLSDDDLLVPITYHNAKGEEYTQTALQILLHVVNHGTDHRAQMLAMMHALGVQTIAQDLIYYFREQA